MKVALVHDYIKEYGGAERVLETLHEIWPDAPVYTSVYLPKYLGPHRERFEGKSGEFGKWDIRTSVLQYLPFKGKLISPIRLIAPLIFKQFDFSEYDVVIVSATGAYAPNNINCHSGEQSDSRIDSGQARMTEKGPLHICYCHTPPRYLYGYATAREWKKNVVFRILGEVANHFLRLVDFKSSQNVDYFIANSNEVKDRIKKFYKREAVVINPPVSLCHLYELLESERLWSRRPKGSQSRRPELVSGSSSSGKEMPKQVRHDKKEEYYLCGGRLARPKHIDLIVRACRELNLPLKVFGKGFAGYEEELKSQISNIKTTTQNSKLKNGMERTEFVGEISDEEKLELMRGAKAYIFASEDEDFGITPVEAMSVGTPVIAYYSGGVKETIVDPSTGSGRLKPTGIFFNELSVGSLSKAIEQFNNITINPLDCINQAQKFSKERFKKEIQSFIVRAKGENC